MAPLGRGELLLSHEPPSNGGWQHRKNDVINGSGTSVGRARAMMHKFAVAPARLIDNGGRRAIGIALRPQHFHKREDLQSMLEIFLGRKIDGGKFDLWSIASSRSLADWLSRAVCLCLVARAHHSQQARATYARSSAGPRIHYLDAPQTQPSSARLQRQQAGRGRLKPGVRQNRVTTALGARRFLGLPLRNATCLLASTPCSSAFNQLWRWGPGRILSVPGCWIAQISADQWGAAMEDEVAIHVHGVSPLPMGIP
ncbi:hypothetical protein THAOC_16793, partial [Thalassiosira oceanica]